MRSHVPNSPEAAARIVALVLIADGHVCRSEIQAVQQHRFEQALGLPDGGFGSVMHALCEDLLLSAYGDGAWMCRIDESALAALLGEVTDPALQREVLRLARTAADADRHLADAEATVLTAACHQWAVVDAELLPMLQRSLAQGAAARA